MGGEVLCRHGDADLLLYQQHWVPTLAFSHPDQLLCLVFVRLFWFS